MTGNRAGYNRELAAMVLLAALYTSDAQACEQYGLSLRSLQRYRQKLASDPLLAEAVAKKKKLLDSAWAEKLPIALSKSLEFLAEAADAAKADINYKRNPMVIQAVAGAMKLIADVLLTSRVIDARLANTDRPANGLPEQIPSGEPKPEYSN